MHQAGVAEIPGGGAGGALDLHQAVQRFLTGRARNHAEVREHIVRLDRREKGEADAPAGRNAEADEEEADRQRHHQVAVDERAGDHAPERPLAEPAEAFVEPPAEARGPALRSGRGRGERMAQMAGQHQEAFHQARHQRQHDDDRDFPDDLPDHAADQDQRQEGGDGGEA